jgi:hypothetical protein
MWEGKLKAARHFSAMSCRTFMGSGFFGQSGALFNLGMLNKYLYPVTGVG